MKEEKFLSIYSKIEFDYVTFSGTKGIEMCSGLEEKLFLWFFISII